MRAAGMLRTITSIAAATAIAGFAGTSTGVTHSLTPTHHAVAMDKKVDDGIGPANMDKKVDDGVGPSA
jgi:hypothetical protein